MADRNDIVRLAIDAYHGTVQNYSVAQSQDVLREALIAANNGSTKLNFRDIRDGKCPELFALLEQILGQTAVEGLEDNALFDALVEFRNVALGDENIFVTDSDDLYTIAEIADGTQGIRRQRLHDVKEFSVPTKIRAVKIYEELSRVLAGRVDFNKMIDDVARSYKKLVLEDISTLWAGLTADQINQMGGSVYFPAAGTFDEEKVLDLIEHVEAAAGGASATILGTKKALRHLKPSIQGDPVEADIYNAGYLGKFFGTPTFALPQRHKTGSTDFVFDDNVITIMASDFKPIKYVYEGDPLVIMGDPLQNGDLTQEYFYAARSGLAIVSKTNSGIGRFEFA